MRVFCFLILLLGMSMVHGETIKVGTFPIPLMVESSTKGVFVELTQAIAKEAGLSIEIIVAPPKRTIKDFGNGKLQGLFPALDVTMPVAFERSNSIYVKRDFAFTQSSKPKVTSIAGLAGKKVALTAGYPYAKEVSSASGALFSTATDDPKNIKKLLSGRVDVFVVEEKSGLKAIQGEGAASKIHYDSASPLSKQDVYYAFQKSGKGKEWADKFSAALEKLKQNGQFAAIMSKAN